MFSTLSLLLPTTIHSNLSRLRSPSNPRDLTPPSEPDYRPWSSPARPLPSHRPSSSSATVSLPQTPLPRAKRSFGALGGSGASTPTEASCEGAALIRSLQESLVEGAGYGGSGIDWDSVRRGLTKISLAAEETNLPPQARNTPFERAEYISGLSHLLASLPPDLTPAELSALHASLSPLHLPPEPAPAAAAEGATYLRRLVRSTVLSLVLIAALLLPHVVSLLRAAARAERRMGIGANFVEIAREAGRKVGSVRGRTGLVSGLEWVGGSVVGGLVEGVEEGVEMLRDRSRPLSPSMS